MKFSIFKVSFFITLIFYGLQVSATSYYVAKTGNDLNITNSINTPFKTIQKAANCMNPGDTCFIREGIYHECVTVPNSGTTNNPICFQPYQHENVILDGTNTVTGKWSKYKGAIYKIKVEADKIEQLFADTAMMTEARWPNKTNGGDFSRKNWAMVDKGSKHGMIVCDAIAKTGIDWTGAQSYLNVAHQWWTWNREITSHKAGSNTLFYPADLVGLCNEIPQYKSEEELLKVWGDDYFYLFGKLEALDIEKEWYFNPKTKELYFYAPEGKNPQNLIVRHKSMDYGFKAKDRDYIVVNGINFFACTFLFDDCNYCSISNCNLQYPTYSRTITEFDQNRQESVITKMVGNYNVVDHISLTFANNMGLMMMGSYNEVRNSIIHDINISGTLIYPALQLSSSPHLGVNWFNTIQYPPTERTPENSDVTSVGNVASHNSLYNCGGAILVYHASKSRVDYNHIYDGGLACKDVSLIYGCWPFSRNSEVCYNWVHGCITDGYGGRGGPGGIGIRADDQSRGILTHHNVVWDCGELGITSKGEDNMIYNNTIFDTHIPILLEQAKEPYKQWAVRFPLLQAQNQWSRVFNNLSFDVRGGRNPKDTLAVSDKIFSNYTGHKILPLKDLAKRDFRPLDNSEIVDKGADVKFLKINFKGKSPDLGAYEAGGENWIPGAQWVEDDSWMKLLLKK